ncbi:putative bifunctional diguanylate cyclase/phosphodiesterase [Desulforamulus ferrireducens]|uniref:Uncharacterized protein n=1 Tax=Desulforamulus ferrireducens TaxID=1833852 RepID=A0A1S6IZ11_9FIRM|nr:EAL domain-containing protein [Desulforamulus ferrireducens]AQS60004.1 hypothetical protein B0537_13530 [Desulforamulus ferrireducens]
MNLLKMLYNNNQRSAKEYCPNEEKFRAVFEKAGIGIVLTDMQGVIKESNPAIQQMLGYSGEELARMTIRQITYPADMALDKKMFQGLMAGEYDSYQMEKRYLRKDGQIFWAKIIVSLIHDIDGKPQHIIGMVEDISLRKQAEEQLEYLASHDPLTNIPNRYSLEKYLAKVSEKSKQGANNVLLILGLDHFKLANDTLGHIVGDHFLVNLVSLLRSHLRPGDFLARLAGDEFAVVLEEVDLEQARQIAEHLREAVEKADFCMITTENCLNLTISIGVIRIDGSLDINRLLSHADLALHAAKAAGRNRVALANPDEENVTNLHKINGLLGLIRAGLREERFVLFFQPVVDRLKRITHHEVLLRLKDSEGKLVPPAVFIPLAEKFGIMPQIDRWVVRNAIKTLQNRPELKLFVNLSGASLGDAELLQEIKDTICESGVEPSRLGFEITETVAVKDFVWVEKWIKRLRDLGCFFALDDFGIGFTSFNYLRTLPVDFIKIDGSYIRNLDQDASQLALVQAIQTVAKALGKQTIAEFVENEKILEIIRELGINYAQGYYLGQPLPEPVIEV